MMERPTADGRRQAGLRRLACPGKLSLFGCALLGCALLACAPKDIYWTRSGGDEAEFRRTSRGCNEKAQIQAFQEANNPNCGYNTRAGTVCQRPVDPNNPFEVDAERGRRERRRQYLYGECMESRGWVKNTDGAGFKSPPTRLPERDR